MAATQFSPDESSAARKSRHDDLDNYGLDDFDDDDPFRSPSPQPDGVESKKRKDDGGLGIDEEVSVAKRARVPRVKLDETRLLSDQGIPKLRKRAKDLKLKGKGHEFSDAARLLAFYQLWLDDLFPKAKFVDALAMAEKVGHKKFITKHRLDWINEGKRKHSRGDDDEDDFHNNTDTAAGETAQKEGEQPRAGAMTNSAEEAAGGARPRTPEADDIFADEDLYNATPLAPKPAIVAKDVLEDEDDLEALMAEAKAADPATGDASKAPAPGVPGPTGADFADEEAAMAEMDGLW